MNSSSISEKLKKIQGESGNLYQHLKKVAVTMALDTQNIEAFEEYSSNLKAKPKPEVVYKVREAYAHLKDYEVKTRALIGKLNSGTEEEPQEPGSLGFVPDFMEEAVIFEKFGQGFGEQESYKIFKSLSRFALKKNAKQIRLWGKILGCEKDYYIIEGIADTAEEQGEPLPDTETKGTGANKYFYWAANELTGDWTELPTVTPAQIRGSRSIKYLFSGNLQKPIMTNPMFPGKQAHLERISRKIWNSNIEMFSFKVEKYYQFVRKPFIILARMIAGGSPLRDVHIGNWRKQSYIINRKKFPFC